MVDAQDFTYSKGYLGLLSTLGATLGIIFCCTPSAVGISLELWRAYLERTSTAVHIDEESAVTGRETPDIKSHPMIDIRATHTHDKSARWSMDLYVDRTESPPCGGLKRHCTF